MPKQPPICSKCGRSHWNFVPCEGVEEHRHASESERERVQRYLRPREGTRVWGDRLHSMERVGETLVQPRKHAVRRTQLIYPKKARISGD